MYAQLRTVHRTQVGLYDQEEGLYMYRPYISSFIRQADKPQHVTQWQ